MKMRKELVSMAVMFFVTIANIATSNTTWLSWYEPDIPEVLREDF